MDDEIEPKRDFNAEAWIPYIRRGASGQGPRGTESTGEYLLVEAAGTVLPGGDAVLTLFNRFSLSELGDIQRAVALVGFECWCYPVEARARKERSEKTGGPK